MSTEASEPQANEFDVSVLWPILADAYLVIESEWWDLISVGGQKANRPDGDNKQVDTIGEVAGRLAAGAAGTHIELLSRAYWPPRTDRDLTPVRHPAIYPPARAALEAMAVVCWSLDPDISTDERRLR